MYDGRTAQETRTFKAIQSQLSPAKVYAPIPQTIAFADASEARLPLMSNPSIQQLLLWKKIAEGLETLK